LLGASAKQSPGNARHIAALIAWLFARHSTRAAVVKSANIWFRRDRDKKRQILARGTRWKVERLESE
jgi:hypothetical protein